MADSALTTKEYWAARIGGIRPHLVESNPFAAVLERWLPVNPEYTCVEVGAYPGSNLCWLAKRFRYRPTAIEYREDAEEMEALFRHNDVPGLTVLREDFLKVRGLAFDVVASFGFVEHFNDPGDIVARHAAMVKDGGFLVLAVPHFGGLQALIRRLVLRPQALRDMLAVHNREIMDLAALSGLVRALGLDVLHAGYAMGFRFWVPWDSPQVRPAARGVVRILNAIDGRWGASLPSCRLLSPMILTVSRKPRPAAGGSGR